MKTLYAVAIFAGVVGGFGLTQAAPAAAQDFSVSVPGFNFSFDTGGVAYAYHDGYWDHDHHWHRWHNEREAREFRARYGDRYDDHMHDRVANAGWREERREERHEEHREERRDHD